MNIETLIYEVFYSEIEETYRYMAPTPGTGSYVVLDMVSDTTPMSKDISTSIQPGSRIRMQAKIYSSDADAARDLLSIVQSIIRTTTNHVVSDAQRSYKWLHAQDPFGVLGGYNSKDKRFYYITDFIVHYSQYQTIPS
jgi:hypothetical protein